MNIMGQSFTSCRLNIPMGTNRMWMENVVCSSGGTATWVVAAFPKFYLAPTTVKTHFSWVLETYFIHKDSVRFSYGSFSENFTWLFNWKSYKHMVSKRCIKQQRTKVVGSLTQHALPNCNLMITIKKLQ